MTNSATTPAVDLDALRRIVATGRLSLPLTVTDAMLRSGLSERWVEDVERVLGQFPAILAGLERAERVEAAAQALLRRRLARPVVADAAAADLRVALAGAPVEASKP